MQKFVTQLLREWDLHPYLWNLVLFGVALLMGLLISFLLSIFVKNQSGETIRFRLAQSLLKHLTAPVSFLVPLLIFNHLLPLVQAERDLRHQVSTGMEVALIIGFAWLMTKTVQVAQDVFRHKVTLNRANNLRQRQIITQFIYIRRVLNIIIVLVAIGAILLSFDTLRKIGAGLLTGVGIGGIIIGFAAQRSLANLLAGFQIAFTQPIRIDDEVIVEGEFGKIEELTLTYVVVRLWDSRRMIMPINYFLEKPFQNWTRTSSEILGTVFLYADYSLPVEWLRQEFTQIVAAHPYWDKRAASLVVTDLKADVMEIRCVVSCSSSGHAFDLRCHVREQLVQRIREEYPQCLPQTRVSLLEEDAAKPARSNGYSRQLS